VVVVCDGLLLRNVNDALWPTANTPAHDAAFRTALGDRLSRVQMATEILASRRITGVNKLATVMARREPNVVYRSQRDAARLYALSNLTAISEFPVDSWTLRPALTAERM